LFEPMKGAFIVGLLVGFGGLLGAAAYPWVDHPRVSSRTGVVANGGRTEAFVIRLPADRILVRGDLAAGLRYPGQTQIGPAFGSPSLLAEHFKVRDSAGEVIGIASRHVVQTQAGAETAWCLVFPGRGAVWLVGAADPTAPQRALDSAGYQPGDAFSGDLRLVIAQADADRSGGLVAGRQEFKNLTGDYLESWQISGVSTTGDLLGTIRLDTVTRQRQ
jgi:hypothetical protein